MYGDFHFSSPLALSPYSYYKIKFIVIFKSVQHKPFNYNNIQFIY